MSVGHLECLPDPKCLFYPSGLSLCLSVDHFGLVSEAFARILTSHGIATANRPYRMPRNFVVHQKEKVEDEEKTELIYRVPCKNYSSSYVGETGRTFGLRIKEHKK